MKTLVTGSSGFIASYLIPELARQGEVVGFDMAPPPDKISPMGSWHRGDLSSPMDIYRVMAAERPTHLVHLASILAEPCEQNPSRGFAINFGSTLTLLDAGRATGLKHFVLASSISVFGRGLAEPVGDNDVKDPSTIYGKTKLASEQVLDWYRKNTEMEGVALRFPWVFGPGRERGITALYSSKLLDTIARNEPLAVDNPNEKGDWLYVKDVVRAIRLALEVSGQNQVGYNIMGGAYSIREVLETARGIVPEAVIEYNDNDSGKAQSPYPSEYDDSIARAELGWRPAYSIQDAVADHIQTVSSSIEFPT